MTHRPLRLRSLRMHPGWIIIVVISAVLLRAAMQSGLTNDTFWHEAAGRWMLDHHAVIRSDVFSYTVQGQPWFADEWGFDVLLAWLVRTLGGTAYWLVSAGACIAALLVSVARWHRLGATQTRTAVLALVAGGSMLLAETPRPQTVSFLLFALELLVLQLARRDRRWLVALPPLLLVWANVHGSFLAGLGVLALEAALAFWPQLRLRLRLQLRPRPGGHGAARLTVSQPLPRRAAVLTLAGAALATLVNPHGSRLFAYAYHVSSASQLTANISEWQSPNFHSPVLLALIVGPAVLLVVAMLSTHAPLEVFDLVVWGALLLATLHAQRFLPYLGLAWGGLAARLRPVARPRLQPSLIVGPVTVLFAAVLVVGPHVAAGAPARGGSAGSPVNATAYITQQLARRPGRVFSTYAWNDYLIASRIPVFVDGRTDLYFGTDVLDEYLSVAGLDGDPDPVLSRWNVRYVMWPQATALSVYLARDPRWRPVYRSGRAEVFTRSG